MGVLDKFLDVMKLNPDDDDDFYDDDFLDDEEDEEPELKTDIQDCRRCWCDTCGRLEECEKHRDGTQPKVTR